ncbi:MAG: PAS domain S-box protein [Chloroflexi bacterium]|nr:PAS domain S-box protein [Chloroflexota bacterium]
MHSEAGERPYQRIFEAVSDGLIIHDAQTGMVVEANPAACAMYGYTPQEFIGQPLASLLHSDSHHLLHDYLQTVQEGGVYVATAVHLRRDGAAFYGEIRGMALTFAQRPCLLSAVRDISQRVQKEQKLAQQTKARIETRASQATLQERQRLAQNLHDAVNQSLFSASLIAEVLPRLWERDPTEGRQALEDLRRLTRGAMAEMRGLLAELRPLVLTDSELGDLLRQFGDALTGRTNIPVQVTVTGTERGPLPADVQVAFYRVCQEALTNIAKHAGASRVEIDLRYEADAVTLRIRDNGQGFDMAHTPAGHYGLSMMRERAKTIGAELTVASQPGQGAEIVIRWTKRLEKEVR